MRAGVGVIVLGLALVLAPSGGTAVAKEVPPFAYTFRITAVTITGTFSHGAAKTSTTLHLAAQPRQKTLTWWGKNGGGLYNGVAAVSLQLAGTIAYSGLDPVCSGTVNAAMPKSHPVIATVFLGDARDPVVTHPTIRTLLTKFAIGDIYPDRNGKCANALNFYQDATGVKPFSVVGSSGFTISAHHSESFDDQAFTDGQPTQFAWSATVTARKIAYKKIDCSHTQLC